MVQISLQSTAADLVDEFSTMIAGKSPEELQSLAYLSPVVHFACFCRVEDKNKQLVEPVPNILQLRMSEAYETLKAMGVRVRIIVTKPRRAGCSTFGAHILYHHGRKVACDGIAISDRRDHSTSLLEKLKAYSTNDSYPWGVQTVANPAHSIEWTNGTKWTIDTAENSNAAVGDTNQLGFFSEVSKWPQTTSKNDAKVMSAVLPTLSGSDTVAIAESTPEGATGWQYQTWGEAWTLEEFISNHQRGIRPEEQWVKVFAGWWEFADNRRREPVSHAEIEHLEETLDEHEIEEREKYGLDWAQIAWRRDTIRTICNGDPKVFSYYYPSDPESCWLASGSPRFDTQVLAEMEESAKGSAWEIGNLVTQHGGLVGFSRDASGVIMINEKPRAGLKYLVSLDPATDSSQTIGADPDRHSLSVWRAGYREKETGQWKRPRKVARLKPPFYGEGDEVAGHSVRLVKYYGSALYVQEVNCGLDILRLVREAGVSCHKRKPLSHRTGKVVEQYGFRLNDQQERNAIIEGFAAAIRERAVDVPCIHSIKEYKAFIVKRKGRAEAAQGHHDDDVLADCMAWELMELASLYRENQGTDIDPPDRGKNSWRAVNHVRRGW